MGAVMIIIKSDECVWEKGLAVEIFFDLTGEKKIDHGEITDFSSGKVTLTLRNEAARDLLTKLNKYFEDIDK